VSGGKASTWVNADPTRDLFRVELHERIHHAAREEGESREKRARGWRFR